MSKYLLDPIKSFREIRNNYITYIKTAFGSRFKDGPNSFEAEREKLLLTDKVLSRETWMEPIPSYPNKERNGKKLTIMDLSNEDLPNMSESARILFKEFINIGLMSYPMYNHQYEMLSRSLKGKDCVITSGTGSGKTESFGFVCDFRRMDLYRCSDRPLFCLFQHNKHMGLSLRGFGYYRGCKRASLVLDKDPGRQNICFSLSHNNSPIYL